MQNAPPLHPFSPAVVARKVAGDQGRLRVSLGCEAPRIGDEATFARLMTRLLDAGPVKLTARAGRPVIAELEADVAVEPELSALGGAAERTGRMLRLTLPLPEPVVDDVPREQMPPDVRLQGRRFLVADDSATNRLILTEMLAGAGAQVDSADSGRAAVTMALSRDYDLLLLDIAMPGMEGGEALGAIRASGCRTPALAVTANAMAHQIEEYLAGGFDGHLAKPLRHEDLILRVRGLLA
ncbi:response regulator [Falsirhodobacter xinxiangensis]|uniref:response regulator n=1 Tax=Falsirhodobacter xinxiangensis TaxID=2530049 RepID=UPI0010AADAAB|nr:response regulator [Rhodobacter xinxiangensis]